MLVVIAAAGISVAMAARRPTDLGDMVLRASMVATFLFYLSTAQFPWYAAWFLPMAAASAAWIPAMSAIGLPVYYLFFPLAASGETEHPHEPPGTQDRRRHSDAERSGRAPRRPRCDARFRRRGRDRR
jgi:hypothetical protein